MEKITAEQVKDGMISGGIDEVVIHNCSICGYECKYQRFGERLFYDAGCYCSRRSPEPREWQDVADLINMQSDEKWREKYLSRFGVTEIDK